MPHGHEAGWEPREIGLFVDSVLKAGEPLPKLVTPMVDRGKITAKLAAKNPLEKAELLSTSDEGPWQQRLWKTKPATIDGEKIEANLPEDRPLVVFLNVIDKRGAVVSSPQVSLPKGE
jgi:hypothetical protein